MKTIATFRIGKGIASAPVEKINNKTIWVNFQQPKDEDDESIFPKYRLIKRHIKKHNVKMRSE
jgi:hypothetical protein